MAAEIIPVSNIIMKTLYEKVRKKFCVEIFRKFQKEIRLHTKTERKR